MRMESAHSAPRISRDTPMHTSRHRQRQLVLKPTGLIQIEMKAPLISSLAIVGMPLMAAALTCPPTWSDPIDGYCYKGVSGPAGMGWNWEEAKNVGAGRQKGPQEC